MLHPIDTGTRAVRNMSGISRSQASEANATVGFWRPTGQVQDLILIIDYKQKDYTAYSEFRRRIPFYFLNISWQGCKKYQNNKPKECIYFKNQDSKVISSGKPAVVIKCIENQQKCNEHALFSRKNPKLDILRCPFCEVPVSTSILQLKSQISVRQETQVSQSRAGRRADFAQRCKSLQFAPCGTQPILMSPSAQLF